MHFEGLRVLVSAEAASRALLQRRLSEGRRAVASLASEPGLAGK
jgi:hypothetical protein